jgi:hypothetical protein
MWNSIWVAFLLGYEFAWEEDYVLYADGKKVFYVWEALM